MLAVLFIILSICFLPVITTQFGCDGSTDGTCDLRSFRLRRPDGIRVGHVQQIRLPEGREIEQKTLSLQPLLFGERPTLYTKMPPSSNVGVPL